MVEPWHPASLSFEDACRQVIEHLKAQVPFACWSVSRFDGRSQVHLVLDDDHYGLRAGDSQPWEQTFCRHMTAGLAPQVAPDAMAVPRYAAAAAAAGMRIGSYAGVPILDGDGALFGTLCGFDPGVRDDELRGHAPLLQLMAALLSRMAHVERERDDATAAVEELRWSARLDPLTGLTARAAFLDALAVAAARAGGAGSPAALVLVGLDVDAVVDTHGHATAGRVLVGVAERLAATLHPLDTAARLDGGEFAVLLHDAADLEATAERVRAVLRPPVPADGADVVLAPSAGVAVLDGSGPDALLARARAARHVGGRWTVRASGPDGPALRAALLGSERGVAGVQAAYQPIVRLDAPGGVPEVVSFEALARWTHEGVPVSPDVFVPLAARCGLLPALTDHMLDLATERLAAWTRQLGHRRLQVGVNVPPVLLLDPAFPDRVAERLRRHGLGPGQLVLEVTEDAVVDDLAAALTVADRLRALGVVLSLDDLGAGYAALLHLRHLPLDVIKIDRAFVAAVDTDPEARRFLAAVLSFGAELGRTVVVEGVEREAQAAVLRDLGAPLAQGFHFGRPTRPEDIDVCALVPVTPPRC